MAVRYEELALGTRRAFVLDRVFDAAVARQAYARFRLLDYGFTDSDRPDTTHVQHLKHDFEPEAFRRDPLLAALIETARDFLGERGIATGQVYRIYANFNLHGDFQFAHEDGEGFTALAFLNARWHEDWGGELLLYPEGSAAFAYAVSPRPGRMAIFDAGVRHRGGVPSKLCFEPRITLAIKFGPAARRARRE